MPIFGRDDAKRVGFGNRARPSERHHDEMPQDTPEGAPEDGDENGGENGAPLTEQEHLARMEAELAAKEMPAWARNLARRALPLAARKAALRDGTATSGRARRSGRRSTRRSARPPLIMPIVFGALATVFLIIGGWMLWETIKFDEVAYTTEGEVRSVSEVRSDDGTTYRPVLRYRDQTGELIDAETHISSSEYDFGIGETVSIRVDPGEPRTVRIDGWFSVWGIPVVFLAFGSVFELAALWMFLMRRRARH